MLGKGKGPKVPTAAARQEPVANIPEGRRPKGRVTRPVRVYRSWMWVFMSKDSNLKKGGAGTGRLDAAAPPGL